MELPLFVAVQKTLAATEPEKRKGFSVRQLEFYRNNLSKGVPRILDDGLEKQAIRRIEELTQDIETNGAKERNESQRQETESQRQESLLAEKRRWIWTVVIAVAGIVVAIGVAVVPLIYNTWFSKVRRATSPQSPPPSYPQTQSPTSESPAQEASSNTATPSPEQASTAQPSVTPPESL